LKWPFLFPLVPKTIHARKFERNIAAQFYATTANNTQHADQIRPTSLSVTPENHTAQNEIYLAGNFSDASASHLFR
jgi:hypothetical protein